MRKKQDLDVKEPIGMYLTAVPESDCVAYYDDADNILCLFRVADNAYESKQMLSSGGQWDYYIWIAASPDSILLLSRRAVVIWNIPIPSHTPPLKIAWPLSPYMVSSACWAFGKYWVSANVSPKDFRGAGVVSLENGVFSELMGISTSLGFAACETLGPKLVGVMSGIGVLNPDYSKMYYFARKEYLDDRSPQGTRCYKEISLDSVGGIELVSSASGTFMFIARDGEGGRLMMMKEFDGSLQAVEVRSWPSLSQFPRGVAVTLSGHVVIFTDGRELLISDPGDKSWRRAPRR